MTHDEMLDKIEDIQYWQENFAGVAFVKAIRAVVDLHKPRTDQKVCIHCSKTAFWMPYPCPTIEIIQKGLA